LNNKKLEKSFFCIKQGLTLVKKDWQNHY